MARLRRLLPAWETCSARMEDPDRRVTGVRPDVGGQVGAGGEGLARGFGQEHCGGRDPHPGHGWSGPGKEGGPAPGPRPGRRHRPVGRVGR